MFLHDETARIPFSIIGVFLILGSSVAAVYIAQLEQRKSQEIVRSLDFSEIDALLREAESDCATALNTAGMKALQNLGKTPVITSVLGPPDLVNQLRVKLFIRAELGVYLTGHYLDNSFSNGRYAINIVLYNETPIISAENITFQKYPMQLNRTTVPLIGPSSLVNHSTYWVASVPLTFEIRGTRGNHLGGDHSADGRDLLDSDLPVLAPGKSHGRV